MTKTLIKSRYNPEQKIKLQTQLLKDNTSTNLPSVLQNFKNNLLSGKGFIVYR